MTAVDVTFGGKFWGEIATPGMSIFGEDSTKRDVLRNYVEYIKLRFMVLRNFKGLKISWRKSRKLDFPWRRVFPKGG